MRLALVIGLTRGPDFVYRSRSSHRMVVLPALRLTVLFRTVR